MKTLSRPGETGVQEAEQRGIANTEQTPHPPNIHPSKTSGTGRGPVDADTVR